MQELKKIKRAKDKLLDKVEKGIIGDDDLKERFQRHKDREGLIEAENDKIQSKINKVPTEQIIKQKAQLMQRVKESYFHSETHLKEMTFQDKRELLQSIFSGTDNEGNRYGVYVEKKGGKDWLYTIRGTFIEEVGRLTARRKKTSTNTQLERDAYNSIGVYKRR